ncbi:radical SAM protein [Thermoanaerobacter sp. X514]|jgi:radical SAM protein with 4Fe4S-binding SPASM domain|uniref:radical SAM/SPASM domain-containing protein n=1 Tax=Thermoanaerobacter sp. (strain X514) TaxID=399726 RepID=UPI0000E1D908|nr:radical SAM protein [Thermoanaerobacter sp. X514]ABY91665.1 Radical SAM domain protein [Thermoanaerobacter sp. X514]MDN5325278.1 hypothetical protein [Thermosipho sp. (in: thermotogales)]
MHIEKNERIELPLTFGEDVREIEIKGVYFLVNLKEKTWLAINKKGKEFLTKLRQGYIFNKLKKEEKELISILHELHIIKGVKHCEGIQKIGPTIAYFHITQRCNLNCPTCFTFSPKRNKLNDMPTEKVKEVLRKIKEFGINEVIFSGGEPFLREDFIKILEESKKLSLSVVVLTNGTLINKEIANKIKGTVDEVYISLDGVNEEIYGRLRGKENFKKVINAIDYLKSENINISLLPTITSINFEFIDQFKEFSDEIKCPINYSLFVPIGAGFYNTDLALNENQLVDFAKWIANQNNVRNFSESSKIKGKSMVGEISIRKGCGLGEGNEISIDADGTIYCCHLLHYSKYKLGELPRSNLEEILSLKTKLCEGCLVDELESCKNCNYRYFCGGGCRAHALIKTGSLQGKDPHCIFYRTFLDEAFSNFLL